MYSGPLVHVFDRKLLALYHYCHTAQEYILHVSTLHVMVYKQWYVPKKPIMLIRQCCHYLITALYFSVITLLLLNSYYTVFVVYYESSSLSASSGTWSAFV